MVLVFSDYSISGAKSLPGAKHDAARVSEAFAKAGFKVQTLLDPNEAQMRAVSNELALQTAAADVAVIYTTGHGVEVNGVTYVLPPDYPVAKGAELLDRRALPVHLIAAMMLRARRANLLFYAGCRDNPL